MKGKEDAVRVRVGETVLVDSMIGLFAAFSCVFWLSPTAHILLRKAPSLEGSKNTPTLLVRCGNT